MKSFDKASFALGLILSAVLIFVFQNFFSRNEVSPRSEQPAEVKEKIVYQCPTDPEADVLAAPSFSSDLPDPLVSSMEGEVKIQWDPVQYAREYEIKMYNIEGKVIRKWISSNTLLYLKELPFREKLEFTPYQITIASINKNKVTGPESEQRLLNSRRIQNLVAPVIKAITVED